MTDLERQIRARRRGQKANRRWMAYVQGLDGYHPLHRERPAWVERAWASIVDPEDTDGPVGDCYCATTRPPCGVCEPSR